MQNELEKVHSKNEKYILRGKRHQIGEEIERVKKRVLDLAT
jgi:hypothetical protein